MLKFEWTGFSVVRGSFTRTFKWTGLGASRGWGFVSKEI